MILRFRPERKSLCFRAVSLTDTDLRWEKTKPVQEPSLVPKNFYAFIAPVLLQRSHKTEPSLYCLIFPRFTQHYILKNLEFSVLLDTSTNWEIFWAIGLLLDNTVESQYSTCDFLSASAAIYSRYDNVLLTSLQDQANGIETRSLYTTLFR